MYRSNTFRANVFNKNNRLTFHLGTHWHCLPSQVFVCIRHDSTLVVKFVPWSTLDPENTKINIHTSSFYGYTLNRKHGTTLPFRNFFSKTERIQTCCSSVMVVWTRMFPCSHGSGMPVPWNASLHFLGVSNQHYSTYSCKTQPLQPKHFSMMVLNVLGSMLLFPSNHR